MRYRLFATFLFAFLTMVQGAWADDLKYEAIEVEDTTGLIEIYYSSDHLFDGSEATDYHAQKYSDSVQLVVRFKTNKLVRVKGYYFTAPVYSDYTSYTWGLYGSNDEGQTWTLCMRCITIARVFKIAFYPLTTP